jgi:hypothetical protein
MVALFERVIAEAAATGRVRGDFAVTGVLLQATMFNAFATTISRSPAGTGDDAAEQLWDLVLNGISASAPARSAGVNPTRRGGTPDRPSSRSAPAPTR